MSEPEMSREEALQWMRRWARDRDEHQNRWPTWVVDDEYGIATMGLAGEPQDPPNLDDPRWAITKREDV